MRRQRWSKWQEKRLRTGRPVWKPEVLLVLCLLGLAAAVGLYLGGYLLANHVAVESSVLDAARATASATRRAQLDRLYVLAYALEAAGMLAGLAGALGLVVVVRDRM